MAQDKTNYNVVQLSDSEWGIQYVNGPLTRGFTTRDVAIDAAAIAATEPSVEIASDEIQEPRTLSEALIYAQNVRDNYREYLGQNPTATIEQKEAKLAELAAADAYVAEYQYQQQIAKIEEKRRDAHSQIDHKLALAQAAANRDIANAEAVEVRKRPDVTVEEIIKAENKAFDAEIYYENLLKNNPATVKSANEGTETNDVGLFDGGSRTYVNYGGQVSSINADISSRSGNTNDIIRTNLASDFGSISRSSLSGLNNPTVGSGTYQQSGNTIYDTSLGVTSVSSTAEQRIKISPKSSQKSMLAGILAPLADAGGVVFPYTPQITYQGKANYNTLTTTHANNDWQIYQNTPSIEIQIQGTFTAQNETEAKHLLAAIHFFRAMTKMHFGDDANPGLPPPQVVLDGYGTHMFNGLSAIVNFYDVGLPQDVDYVMVNSGGGISKVPAFTTINVSLTIQQTPQKSKTFSWDNFATGELMQKKGWL